MPFNVSLHLTVPVVLTLGKTPTSFLWGGNRTYHDAEADPDSLRVCRSEGVYGVRGSLTEVDGSL